MDGAGKGSRSLPSIIGILSVPVFAVLFYLLSSLVRRYSPFAAAGILAAGAAFLGYLLWSVQKLRRS
jgi:threonine/homoserine/homoserine lactone efflux protein